MDGSTIEFLATGTRWQVDFLDNIPLNKLKEIESILKARAEEFETTYSRFRENTLVSNMSKEEGVYELPPDGQSLFDTYWELAKATDENFSPLVGKLLVDAGYDKELSFLKKNELEKLPKIASVLDYTFPKVTVKKPWQLDFGAAGKGYLVDILGTILEEMGITDFCVDAGGDMLHRTSGDRVLRVGLENPEDANQVIGVAEIDSQSICGSSGNRRRWSNFHHIINPTALLSPTTILSTWVIADSTMLADGLATCLFFSPAKRLLEHFTFDYLILNSDFTIEKSDNFKAELFLG